MSDPTVIAAVECPVCHKVMAKVIGDGEGGLTVTYREAGIRDRPESARGVAEVRPWQTSTVDLPILPDRYQLWACTCREARCSGRFLLDLKRVGQLVGRATAVGSPIVWHPNGDDVDRSDRLRPMVQAPARGDLQAALRLALAEPPPLSNDSVRTTKTIPA